MNPLATAARLDRLDALRAIAMLWMTAYHFCYDLAWFGVLKGHNFYDDALWTWQRTAIVALFVGCSGLAQAVALYMGQSWRSFWRRWLQVAACAALVSAASYAAFGPRFIHFGVLHAICVMLLIGRVTAGLGLWLLPLGAGLIAFKAWLSVQPAGSVFGALMHSRLLNPLGLIHTKPATEDYVPLLPWLGVFWVGLGLGQLLMRKQLQFLQPGIQGAGSGIAPLAVLGRWSLSYYMLHQPVLVALVWLGVKAWVE